MLYVLLSVQLSAQTDYTLTSDDVEIIDGVIKSCSYDFTENTEGTNLTIPETLDGQTVIGIVYNYSGLGVFKDKNIQALTLPKTIQTIGYSAFYRNSITNLDLSDCTALASIGWHAFNNNPITSLDLGNCIALKSIGTFAFYKNSLTNLDLTDCTALTHIGSDAFSADSLDCLSLPIPIYDGFTFYGWKDDDAKEYSGGATVLDLMTSYTAIFNVNDYTLTSEDVEIKGGVIQSCSFDFTQNPGGTNLTIPETLDGETVIGIVDKSKWEGVFHEKNIQSLTLPSTLQTIGYYAFSHNSLSSLDLTNCTALTSIRNDAFSLNELSSLDLTNCIALTSIGDNAFVLNSLTSLDLTACVALSSIGDRAFYFNSIGSLDLTDLTNLRSIGTRAFSHNSLATLYLTGCTALTSIGTYAFSSNSLANLDLVDCISLASIEEKAFYSNSLVSLDLTSCTALKNIGEAAFYINSIVSCSLPTHTILNSLGWTNSDAHIYEAGDSVTDFNTGYYIPGEGVDYFNINYNLVGGTNSTLNQSVYLANAGVDVFYDASRLGYTFGGWYIDDSFNTKVTSIAPNVTSDIPLYAQWIQVSCIDDFASANISLYPNPASTSVMVLNLTCGDLINIYSISGALEKQVHITSATQKVNIADLNAGVHIMSSKGMCQRLMVE